MPNQNNDNDIQAAAALIIQQSRSMHYRNSAGPQVPPAYDIARAHSINLLTEEFLAGYMQDGRMSVVRRFFCLFVTFDLFFVSLLWLICIMISGDNIFHAFQKQIVHYTIYTSLFDVVAAAIFRFLFLIFFYALLYVNHWIIIALSTSGSCLFLISKVFVYDWLSSKEQVFEVILIIASFILAWGEAWFFDGRVLPQERHARRYLSTITSSDRSPLISPFLIQNEPNPLESVVDFYSPLDSDHSNDAEEELDEEYRQMGLSCVRRAYALLEATDWKVEKVNTKGDTISSKQIEKLGKVFRLTGRVKYNAKALMEELFYKIEEVPKWNPTLLESKIKRKINSYTDITYQASVGGGGGFVKSRDFVNLRCWRLVRNGKVCMLEEDYADSSDCDDDTLNRSCEGSVSTVSDGESWMDSNKFVTSSSSQLFYENEAEPTNNKAFETLSKSLGAKEFVSFDLEEPPLLEEFEDATGEEQQSQNNPTGIGSAKGGAAVANNKTKEKVWVSAAITVDYPQVPPTSKYIRGEVLVAGFALREIVGKPDACIFEWILCMDLKGYIPRLVLDATYTTFMTDYMTHLRKYVSELRQRRTKVPRK